ncbi:unnamed protein product, partial [Adineta steineri]
MASNSSIGTSNKCLKCHQNDVDNNSPLFCTKCSKDIDNDMPNLNKNNNSVALLYLNNGKACQGCATMIRANRYAIMDSKTQ